MPSSNNLTTSIMVMFQKVLLRIFLISLFTFIIWRISHLSLQYSSRSSVKSTPNYNYDGSQIITDAESLVDHIKFNFSKKTNKTLQRAERLREQKMALKLNPDEVNHYKMKGNKSSIVRRYSQREKALMGNPYNMEENRLKKSPTSWEDFINSPMVVKPRNRQLITNRMLSTLLSCPTSGNTSLTSDRCTEILGDSLITNWRNRMVKDLCEANANSKIRCYDSAVGKSKYCIFDNAMMNFRKMRKRKQDGAVTRSWERGFISADCGEFAKDDIGYSMLYKPDIENRDSAMCDYVFNETVLVYSHENSRNVGHMVSDYMNVWTMLWLAGVGRDAKDITFLNIDAVGAIKKGKYYGDQTNHFFGNYNVSFRRIIKAIDFAEPSPTKVCFKRIMLQPRPEIQFLADVHVGSGSSSSSSSSGGGPSTDLPLTSETRCNFAAPSSLFQRWNLHLRYNFGHLRNLPEEYPTNNAMQILLVIRRSRGENTIAKHVSSRIFLNEKELVSALNKFVSSFRTDVPIKLVVQDFSSLSYEQQSAVVGNSSIIIGMHGAGIASSIHMAVGTRYCCGVIEIFPEGEFKQTRGYGTIARRMGHRYERIDISSNFTEASGTAVPLHLALGVLSMMTKEIYRSGSCLLPAVIASPFL